MSKARLTVLHSSGLFLGSALSMSLTCALISCGNSDGGTAGSAGSAGAVAGSAPSGGNGNNAGTGDSGGNTTNGGSGGTAQAGMGDTAGVSGAIAHGGAPTVDYGNATPPSAQWADVTGTLAGMQSECGNTGGIYSNPYLDMLVVGIARQGLWASTDGAATYKKIGATGDPILGRLSTIFWDPVDTKTFWVSVIYAFENPFTNAIFKTTDNGASFKGYATLAVIQSHNDSVSVDFSDPARKTMFAGGHEQTDKLFRSTDAGATWSDIGKSLTANHGFCTATLVLDAKTILVGCAAGYSQKPGGILRSTDGGDSFAQVNAASVFGRPLWASDGTIYWSGEGGGMFASTDQGKTFQQVADKGTAGSVAPIELPGGRVVSIANRTLKGTADGGKTWTAIGMPLPWDPTGITYSPFRRAFYAWHFDCGTVVPAASLQRAGFDFKK